MGRILIESLKEKNIMITGTNRGLGKQLVESFASQGANLIAHSRKETPEFKEFISTIANKHKITIYPIYCDLLNDEDTKNAIKQLFQAKINIDVLVNNAGVAHGGLFQMTSIENIKKIYEINLFSAMTVTQFVLRNMIKNKRGVIINVASISGLDLHAGNCAYGTSKAALIAFTKTLSTEVAMHGIRVNAIAPGLLKTDMADLMEIKAKEEMISNSAMNRLGEVNEVADLVCYLASDQASFITGQVIRCDGGRK